jgi:hypothetical protein
MILGYEAHAELIGARLIFTSIAADFVVTVVLVVKYLG